MPPEFVRAHAAWLESIESYDWAAENPAIAFVGPDETLMRECFDHIETASARFESAAASLAEADTP